MERANKANKFKQPNKYENIFKKNFIKNFKKVVIKVLNIIRKIVEIGSVWLRRSPIPLTTPTKFGRVGLSPPERDIYHKSQAIASALQVYLFNKGIV